VLRELEQHGESFEGFTLRISRAHREYCLHAIHPLPERRSGFEAEVQRSLEELAALEASQRGSFEDYLAAYLAD
jgi:glutamate--cysteine ligase